MSVHRRFQRGPGMELAACSAVAHPNGYSQMVSIGSGWRECYRCIRMGDNLAGPVRCG